MIIAAVGLTTVMFYFRIFRYLVNMGMMRQVYTRKTYKRREGGPGNNVEPVLNRFFLHTHVTSVAEPDLSQKLNS